MKLRRLLGSTCCVLAAAFSTACGSTESPAGAPTDAGAETSAADAAAHDVASEPDAEPTDTNDAAAADAPPPKAPVKPAACKKVAISLPTSEDCGNDHWCFTSPTPTGRDFFAVYAAGPADVWLAGRGGDLLRWNGTKLTRSSTGKGRDVVRFAKHPTEGAWIVDTDCNLFRLAGSTWTPTAGGACTGSALDLWIGAADDAWVVGHAGRAQHWDGSKWTRIDAPKSYNLYAVSGSSNTDVWAVGQSAYAVRWNGSTWSEIALPGSSTEQLRAVYAPAPGEAWIGGTSNKVWHVTGGSSVALELPGGVGSVRAIWGTGADDVWFAEGEQDASLPQANVFHWNGVTLTKASTLALAGIEDLHGASASEVWAVGRSGSLAKWNGTAWSTLRSGPAFDIHGMWGSASNDVWAAAIAPGSVFASKGALLHFDGTSWSVHTTFDHLVTTVWGTASDDVWAGGEYGKMSHWDGKTWAPHPSPDGIVSRLWGAASDDVWGIDGTELVHWDGATWSRVSLPGTVTEGLQAITGTSTHDVWTATFNGTVFHWDGSSWSQATKVPDGGVSDLYAAAPNDLWVSGRFFDVYRWHGSAWTKHETDVSSPRVWGFGPDDVWFGGGSVRHHWDGTKLDTTRVELGATLDTLWGCSPDDLWMAGKYGTIAHRQP